MIIHLASTAIIPHNTLTYVYIHIHIYIYTYMCNVYMFFSESFPSNHDFVFPKLKKKHLFNPRFNGIWLGVGGVISRTVAKSRLE